MNDVHICLEEGLDRSLFGVQPDGDGTKYTGDCYSIAWLGEVDEFVVETERDGMWRLTVRDGILGEVKHVSICEEMMGTMTENSLTGASCRRTTWR